MHVSEKDLRDNLIMDFSYHDAEIIKVSKNKKDVTILLDDGFNEGQNDELKFINCEFSHKNDLENRIIYQLDDLVNFDRNIWHMSFLVWVDGNLLEKVVIEADNIISKKYDNGNVVQEEDLNKEIFNKR